MLFGDEEGQDQRIRLGEGKMVVSLAVDFTILCLIPIFLAEVFTQNTDKTG